MTTFQILKIGTNEVIGTVEASTVKGAKMKWGKKVNDAAGEEGRTLGASYWHMHKITEAGE